MPNNTVIEEPGPALTELWNTIAIGETVIAGDIQVPGQGAPYALLADCQTTGGYPRIATILPCDLPRVAQASPGTKLRFSMITREGGIAAELKERKEYLFEKLGINEFRKKRMGQMSTGMKQKVSIARTLIHDPEVLIFDEPTSGLDVITADSIIDLIRESKENNKTVIVSSHIMSEVDLLCDDLAIINKGSIIYNDSFENFKKEMKADNLTQEFINRVKEA